MRKLTTIRLYGSLAKAAGQDEVRVGIRSASEAFKALGALFPETKSLTSKGRWKIWKSKGEDHRPVFEQTLKFSIGDADTIHIVPEGTQAGPFAIPFLLGGLLVAGVAIAASLFLPIPTAPNSNDFENDRNITSGIIDRPATRVAEGHPGSLIYGEVFVSPHVVSATIEVSDTGTAYFGGDGSNNGGFDGGGGTYWTEGFGRINVFKGGGKSGAGGSSSLKEDPDTLQSNATARILGVIGVGKQVGIPGTGQDKLKNVYVNDTQVRDGAGNDNVPGFAITVRTGEDDQNHIPGFESSGAPQAKNVQITNALAQVHTITDPLIDSANVVLRIPALHILDDENQKLSRTSVDCKIELQSAGGGYADVYSPARFSGKTTSPYQRGYRVALPEGGAPWDIRVSRITGDTPSATIQDDTYLDFITETIDQKFAWPGVAFVGITINSKLFGSEDPRVKMRWRGRIMQVPDNFDPVARTYAGNWDGITFKEAYCDDPAWAVHDIATNDFFGAGNLTRGMVNVWDFYSASVYNSALVPDGQGGTEFRHTISMVINTRAQALTLIRSVCTTFRAHPYWGSEGLSIFQERPVAEADKILLVPANISKKGIVYDDLPADAEFSAATVWYNDIDALYEPKPATQRDPDLVRRIGFEAKQSSSSGAATRGEASRAARWLLEEQEYLGEFATLDGGRALSRVYPGVVAKIHDPRFTVGSMGGRLASVAGNNVTLDREFTIEAGRTYSIGVMLPDGSYEERALEAETPGQYTVLRTQTALSQTPVPDSPWAIESDIVKLKEFRIMSATDIKGGKRLRMRRYDETSWLRVEDQLSIEPESTSDLPTGGLASIDPASINILEFQHIDGDSSVPSALISWTASPDQRVSNYDVEITYGDDGYFRLIGGEELSREIIAVQAGPATVRVRPRDNLGRTGAWQGKAFTIVAGTQAMPEVTNLRVEQDNDALQTWLRWDVPTDPRPLRFQVFKNFDLLGTTDKNEHIVTESATYFVLTSYMDQLSTTPLTLSVVFADFARETYNNLINRPLDLQDFDPTAYDEIQINSLYTGFDEADNLANNSRYRKWSTGAPRPVGWRKIGAASESVESRDDTITFLGAPMQRVLVTTGLGISGTQASSELSNTGGAGSINEQGFPDDLNYPRWLVLTQSMYLASGTWDGAGFLIQYKNAGAVVKNTFVDVDDTVPIGKITVFKTLIDMQNDTANDGVTDIVYTRYANRSNFGTMSAKDIRYGPYTLRPATQEEIDAERISDIEASVTINQGVLAGHTIDIGNNSGTIAGHTTDIGNNTGSISGNATSIGNNATAIGSNTTGISDNLTNIGNNLSAIALNVTNLSGIRTYNEAYYSIVLNSGGYPSGLAIRNATSGSVTVSDFLIESDTLRHSVKGDVIWTSDAAGLEMNQVIRFKNHPTNPTTMRVIGNEFGLNGKLMDWFGPYSDAAGIPLLTPQNGRRAMDVDGKSYLNGVEEGADAKEGSATGTTLAELTNQASNGNDVEVNAAGGASFTESVTNTNPGAPWTAPATPTMQLKLRRKIDGSAYADVFETAVISGTSGVTTVQSPVFPETGEYIHTRFWNVSTAFSHTQTGSGSNTTTYDWEVTRTALTASPVPTTQSVSVSFFEP